MSSSEQPEASGAVAATAMFVEVLVVGIGFLAAVVCFGVAILGPHDASKLSSLSSSNLAASAGLAFAYATGILVDRLADTLLGPVRRHLRARSFSSDTRYAQARLSLANFPQLVARADYARSRMRICRGWSLNSILLAIGVDFVVFRFPFEHRVILATVSTSMGVAAMMGFYSAWRAITVTGYKKLAEQTAALAEIPAQLHQ